MKTTVSKLAIVAASALALFITSCGDKKGEAAADTPDSVTDELLTTMDDLSATIATAKDKESAEAAATKIGEIGDEFLAIAKRLDALDEPSEEVKKELDEKMDKAMEEKQGKMMEAMKAISSNPEAMTIVGKAMEAFGEKMNSAEDIFKKFGKKD